MFQCFTFQSHEIINRICEKTVKIKFVSNFEDLILRRAFSNPSCNVNCRKFKDVKKGINASFPGKRVIDRVLQSSK